MRTFMWLVLVLASHSALACPPNGYPFSVPVADGLGSHDVKLVDFAGSRDILVSDIMLPSPRVFGIMRALGADDKEKEYDLSDGFIIALTARKLMFDAYRAIDAPKNDGQRITGCLTFLP